MDGTWESTDTWGGFKSGMVTLSPYNEAIPDDVVELAESARQAIADGKVHPFAGPVKDQSGKVVVPEGQVDRGGLLLGMNLYVEGVGGKFPQKRIRRASGRGGM